MMTVVLSTGDLSQCCNPHHLWNK